jgi:hypothetical protein
VQQLRITFRESCSSCDVYELESLCVIPIKHDVASLCNSRYFLLGGSDITYRHMLLVDDKITLQQPVTDAKEETTSFSYIRYCFEGIGEKSWLLTSTLLSERKPYSLLVAATLYVGKYHHLPAHFIVHGGDERCHLAHSDNECVKWVTSPKHVTVCKEEKSHVRKLRLCLMTKCCKVWKTFKDKECWNRRFCVRHFN